MGFPRPFCLVLTPRYRYCAGAAGAVAAGAAG